VSDEPSPLVATRAAVLAGVMLVVPLVLAAITLRATHWRPVLDLAMTEFRVRDVGGRHTPLIGLPGRIGVFPDQGSHPGPLSFYLLAPMYRVLGATAWGLQVAMITLLSVATVVALWLARRRGGTVLVVGVAVLLAVLLRGYGLDVVTQPWNPYLPLLWWFVTVLAVWGVLADDLRCLPVAVVAGSLCAQTHLPYLGLALGMGALCAAVLAVTAWRHPIRRFEVGRVAGGSVLIGAVLWSPVVLDELRRSPGNLSMLATYFRTPPEDPVGAAEGVALLLRHLNVFRLVGASFGDDGFITRAGFDLTGSVLPGLVVLGVWIGSVVFAVKLRDRRLLALHALVGWWSLLAAFSMGRIFGKVWFYLTLWAWMLGLLMVAAVLLTAWMHVARRAAEPPVPMPSMRRGAVVVAAVVGVGTWAGLVIDSFDVRAPEQHLSDTLDELIEPTARAIDRRIGDAAGRDGRYWITWSDARYFGSQGYGLLNELERRGYQVYAPYTWRVPVTEHRTAPSSRIDAEIRLATGVRIEEVAALPGAEKVVEYDPRNTDELAEYANLEEAVRTELLRDGLGDLVPLLDTNLFGLQIDPRVSIPIQRKVDRMLELGTRTAVFILPTGDG
jgi:hypothetical protein